LRLCWTWHCKTTKHIWTENRWIVLTSCSKQNTVYVLVS
jgi:hypothetical protein